MIGLYQFLSGIVMMGCAVSSLYFLKFWLRTKDRLFLIFGCALFTLAAERAVLALTLDQTSEEHSMIYIVRLIAFLLILAGIVDKNLSEKRRGS
jgi:uncharacterized membrane protein HdeD (DUF308 family)